MRFGTAQADGATVPVTVGADGLHPLAGVDDLASVIRAGAPARPGPDPLADGRLVAPLRPGKIVAIGLNYADHIREAGAERPARPLVFAKFPSSVIGPDDPIVLDPGLTRRVDWEVELAVVIGATLRRATRARALAGIFGYTVANDVSARDVQFADGQWVRGKSVDTFCPLGPVIVTPDEIGDPQKLRLRTRVNDETVQDSTTAEMVFGVADGIGTLRNPVDAAGAGA